MNLLQIPPDHRATIERLFQGGDKLLPKQEDFDFSVLHAAVGICTEAGELLEAVQAMQLTRSFGMPHSAPWEGVADSPGVDIENIKEELGDHLFYEGSLRIATDLEELPPAMLRSPYLWPRDIGPLSQARDPEIGRKRVLIDLVMVHAAVAGQILDVAKRLCMYRKPFDSEPKDGYTLRERLTQYLVDDCWVISEMAALIGTSEEELREGNIIKLEKGKKGQKARYADGFSEEAANKRADKENIGITIGNPDAVARVKFVDTATNVKVTDNTTGEEPKS